MLKSCHRKDIEDKGTSGETFLAAIEYLEQEQPAVAIFENVLNAPWDKMQEYIRGRLNLKDRNSIKNITEIKKGQAGEYWLIWRWTMLLKALSSHLTLSFLYIDFQTSFRC